MTSFSAFQIFKEKNQVFKSIVSAALLILFTRQIMAEDILIELPLGGWRYSQGEEIQFTQVVNYPASSVNVQDEQSPAAMIKGRIAESLKDQTDKPFMLIVNGIPMPMQVEGEGFSRPYTFGPGSNNVEVRSPDGNAGSHIQFYEAYSGMTQPRLRVVLSWDTDSTDLDLHVVTPDGEHCFYGNRVLQNGGALDVDVTTGYGPEIFATPAPRHGTYLIFLNYYGSGGDDDITVAQVTIITHENTLDEKVQTVTIPMRSPGELTLVSTFVYP